jgi:hypothetical protein
MKFVSEPVRLRREKGSALEHALLSAGAATDGAADRRAKTLAALGLAGSAALTAGTASAASVSSLSAAAKIGWAKLALGVSLVGAVTAVPVGYYYTHRPAPAVRALRPVAAPVVAARVAAPPAAPAEQPAEIAPQDETKDETPSRLPHARPAARAVERGTLTHELAALDAARAKLADGDAKSALALLDIYGESFPHGRLALEAEVLRIDALAKSGQRQAARQRANAFLRRHPTSVLASRVRAQALPGE